MNGGATTRGVFKAHAFFLLGIKVDLSITDVEKVCQINLSAIFNLTAKGGH